MAIWIRTVPVCGGVTGQGINAGNDWGSDARPAKNQPAARTTVRKAIVDRNAGVWISNRGDVSFRSLSADTLHVGVAGLPGLLGHVGATPAAGAVPGSFTTIRVTAANGERRSTHSGYIATVGRVLDAIAAVPAAGRDGDAPVGVVRTARRSSAARLASTVAIADCIGAKPYRRIDCRSEIGDRGTRGLDQQDVAVRADGADHVEIERDFLGPTTIGLGQAGRASILIYLGEAPTATDREPKGGPVRRKIGRSVRIIVRIDNGDGLTASCSP